ncbi:uncharacterized protein [Clytia hemisphaerica]|uniref:EF-hand domain-containing protein n=1 Tax=Clytia hemisphaerica TaxID=252671 RepID=A0A7M5X8G0_9CNID|eukprot:TCONS_00054197-protein
MSTSARNIVTTDMKTIRDYREVHDTEEFNAFIEMNEKKMAEREANNRRGDAGFENERSTNKKIETKKEQRITEAKEKAKEHKKKQEKILAPPTPPPQEEEEVIEEVKPMIDEEEWKRRVMEDIVESFHAIDLNGDGKISVHELMSAMNAAGEDVSAEDIEDIFDVIDLDGDGEISFEEFKDAMYEKMSQQTVDEDLIGAFEIFDDDGDGYISPTEIQLMFKKLGELISTDEAVEMMKDCDINKDGLIDFEEFKAFYLKIFENQPTLAEMMMQEQERIEKEEIDKAEWDKLNAQFPASGHPESSIFDYK